MKDFREVKTGGAIQSAAIAFFVFMDTLKQSDVLAMILGAMICGYWVWQAIVWATLDGIKLTETMDTKKLREIGRHKAADILEQQYKED